MKIALVSTFVPFIAGGARNIVDWLELTLQEHGHQVERIYLPQVDSPGALFQQMMAFRWIDLEAADRVICFRPQAHLIQHPQKTLWFIHHVRAFYDLWETPYRGFPNDLKHRGERAALHAVDRGALLEARAVFTNSRVVSSRLKIFNGIDSEVLYPPVFQPERFFSRGHNDTLVCICRMEHHKRQHLLIEAMQYTTTPVRLYLAGTGASAAYSMSLADLIARLQLQHRVTIDDRWISESEKLELLADCLAAVYAPFDEDSYGYPSVEAGHASKPVLTTTDSGGVVELVQDGLNGYVSDPSPQALAAEMDRLYADRAHTARMGAAAAQRLVDLKISWHHVVSRLLA